MIKLYVGHFCVWGCFWLIPTLRVMTKDSKNEELSLYVIAWVILTLFCSLLTLGLQWGLFL